MNVAVVLSFQGRVCIWPACVVLVSNCLYWFYVHTCVCICVCVVAEYGLRLASHIFVKDISPESLAARDGNIQEGDVVLKVRSSGYGRVGGGW